MTFLYSKSKRKCHIYLFVLVTFMLQITLASIMPLAYADENLGTANEVTEIGTENEGPAALIGESPEGGDISDGGTDSGNGDINAGEPGAGEEPEGGDGEIIGDPDDGEPDDGIGDGVEEPDDGAEEEAEDEQNGEKGGVEEETEGKQDDEEDAVEEKPQPMIKSMQLLGGRAGEDLGNIFTDVTLKIQHGSEEPIVLNDDEDTVAIEIQDDTVVLLEYEWEIDDDEDLEDGPFAAGDYAETTIPSVFQGLTGNLTGNLEWGSDTVGTYSIDGNTLRVEFNERLEGLQGREGTVWVWLEFKLEEFEENVTQTIEFGEPISKSFTITLKPQKDVETMTKLGVPDSEINAEYIDWVIDVNISMEKLDNAIVEDIIPDGLELDSDHDIKIYELIVGYYGEITEWASKGTTTAFPVELGKINSAYRIKYRTTIIDNSKDEYRNIATLKDDEEEKDTAEYVIGKLKMGSSIEKTGKADQNGEDSTKITWTIDINKAQLDLNNVSVDDVILEKPEGVELEINKDSIKVYKLKP